MTRDPAPGPARRVTSAEVAAALGVSQSTVSLALSASSRVSEETRRRVVEVSERLGYRPLAAGRRLRTGRSDTVGVLVPALGFEAFDRILTGVREGLRADGGRDGFAVLVGVTGNDPDEQQVLSAVVEAHDFDALVLAAVGDPSPATLQRFTGRIVALESAPDGVPSVGYDLEDACRQVVEHLAAHGHRRVAHLAALTEKRVVAELRAALVAAGRAAGDVAVEAVDARGWTVQDAVVALAPVLARPPGERPTAVVCDDARLTSAAYAGAADAGLRVPEDLSVVCGHLEDATSALRPPVTGLERPAEELGRVGAQLVRALVAGRPHPPSPPLRCRLVVAGSTAPAPRVADDPGEPGAVGRAAAGPRVVVTGPASTG